MKETRRIFIIHVFLLLIVQLLFAPAAAQENSRSPAPSKSRTESSNEAVPYSNLDPSTAILIMVIVMAFFFIGFFVIYIRQCASDTSVSPAAAGAGAASFPPRSRLVGLEPAVIETFPVLLYSEVKEIKIGRETLECAVCLCEFEDDETLRLLPKCSHVFHPDCIDLWLASHVTCPVCRANLKPEPEEAAKTESNEQPSNQQQPQRDALSPPEIGETRPQNDVVITVEEEEEEQRESVLAVATANRPPISGKFPRSHSTGHSLVQPGENVDRYTLRLPEEARRQIMETARLKRVRSFNVIFAGEGSLRKGYGGSAAAGGGFGEGSSRGRLMERFERWVLLRTPPFPFVSKGGSLRSFYDGDSSHGRRLLSSLSCLSRKVDGADQSSTMMASPAHRRL